MTTAPISRDDMLSLPEVIRITGLSRSAIYRKAAQGEFPLAKQLSVRTVAWSADSVLAWKAALRDAPLALPLPPKRPAK